MRAMSYGYGAMDIEDFRVPLLWRREVRCKGEARIGGNGSLRITVFRRGGFYVYFCGSNKFVDSSNVG